GGLLESLQAEYKDADPDSYHALYVRHAAHLFEQSRKLPPRLVEELARESVLATEAWRKAREENDFSRFAPHLEKLVALTIEKAERLGYQEDRYDALLDQFEPEMPTKAVEEVFAELKRELVQLVEAVAAAPQVDDGPLEGRCDKQRQWELKRELVPLVEAVAAAPQVDDGPLKGRFDKQRQWELNLDVLRAIGYDMERGRLDESAHPFTISFSRNDVRITTRVFEDDWASA